MVHISIHCGRIYACVASYVDKYNKQIRNTYYFVRLHGSLSKIQLYALLWEFSASAESVPRLLEYSTTKRCAAFQPDSKQIV